MNIQEIKDLIDNGSLKHSKAPWRSERRERLQIIFNGDNKRIAMLGTPITDAESGYDNMPHWSARAEVDANARLMASSLLMAGCMIELLEALEEMERYTEESFQTQQKWLVPQRKALTLLSAILKEPANA